LKDRKKGGKEGELNHASLINGLRSKESGRGDNLLLSHIGKKLMEEGNLTVGKTSQQQGWKRKIK